LYIAKYFIHDFNKQISGKLQPTLFASSDRWKHHQMEHLSYILKYFH